MQFVAAAACIAVLAGCGGKKDAATPPPDAAIVRPVEKVDYEIAVVIEAGYVSVALTDRIAHCKRFDGFLPEPDTCDFTRDDIRLCGSLRCLSSLRTESSGKVLHEEVFEGSTAAARAHACRCPRPRSTRLTSSASSPVMAAST